LQIPSDPKLVVAALQPKLLSEFRVTQLERNQKLDVVLEPNLGINVSLLDISCYGARNHGDEVQLAPEDEALLEVQHYINAQEQVMHSRVPGSLLPAAP
jgi:Paf1